MRGKEERSGEGEGEEKKNAYQVSIIYGVPSFHQFQASVYDAHEPDVSMQGKKTGQSS